MAFFFFALEIRDHRAPIAFCSKFEYEYEYMYEYEYEYNHDDYDYYDVLIMMIMMTMIINSIYTWSFGRDISPLS